MLPQTAQRFQILLLLGSVYHLSAADYSPLSLLPGYSPAHAAPSAKYSPDYAVKHLAGPKLPSVPIPKPTLPLPKIPDLKSLEYAPKYPSVPHGLSIPEIPLPTPPKIPIHEGYEPKSSAKYGAGYPSDYAVLPKPVLPGGYNEYPDYPPSY